MLFKDDPDKGGKAGTASPKRRLTQPNEDTGKIGIPGRQRSRALAERGASEASRNMGQRICFC
jgi:hypothetical protein